MAAGRAIFVSFVACHLVAYVSAWGTVPTSLLVQQVEEQQKDIRLKPIDGRSSLPKADSSQVCLLAFSGKGLAANPPQ